MNRLNQVKKTQMVQSNQSTQYICWPFGKSSISCWPFFVKRSISLTFFGIFWINSIDSIIPVPQSQSTQSPTLWKRIDSVTKWRNRIDSINFAKKELIQINQLSRVDWYTSLVRIETSPGSKMKASVSSMPWWFVLELPIWKQELGTPGILGYSK